MVAVAARSSLDVVVELVVVVIGFILGAVVELIDEWMVVVVATIVSAVFLSN